MWIKNIRFVPSLYSCCTSETQQHTRGSQLEMLRSVIQRESSRECQTAKAPLYTALKYQKKRHMQKKRQIQFFYTKMYSTYSLQNGPEHHHPCTEMNKTLHYTWSLPGLHATPYYQPTVGGSASV